MTDAEKARELDWLLKVTGMRDAQALAALLFGHQLAISKVRAGMIERLKARLSRRMGS